MVIRFVLCLLLVAAPAHAQSDAYFAPANDRAFLEGAIASEAAVAAPGVTGITVPHHLLAADLIARGFRAASAGSYRRVILIAPDHYRAVRGRFATSAQALQTVFGPLSADKGAVEDLLATDLFETGDVYSDHGLFALAPFVARFFPDAEVVPVLASIYTTPEDWAEAAKALAPLTADALVVQSTDFSHYLDQGTAALRDAESLGAIATGDPVAIEHLSQPGHMDSRAAMVIQMRLQAGLGARATVIANRNSLTYGGESDSTTSYVVAVWHPDPEATAGLRYADHEVVYFGGDVLLGRFFTSHLMRPEARSALVDAITTITDGAPLVANLEGVLIDGPVAHAPMDSHLMPLDIAGPILGALGVTAMSLANNHSFDFGDGGYRASIAALGSLGIRPLEHGVVEDIGPLRLLALNLLPGGRDGLAEADYDPEEICSLAAQGPLVVFAHWGAEYTAEATDRERQLGRDMASCAVGLVIGAHSHRASDGVFLAGPATPVALSLGNLIFDQSGDRVSSALLEVRVFRQGTLSARLIPLPNLFEMAAQPPGQRFGTR